MVALFILALVSSAGASLLIGATGAGKQIREREGEARQIDIAQRLIRQAHARLVRDIPHQPMYHDPEDAFVSSDFHALHGDLSAALAAAEQTRLWPWYSLLDNLAFQDHWDDPRLLAWVEEHEGRE